MKQRTSRRTSPLLALVLSGAAAFGCAKAEDNAAAPSPAEEGAPSAEAAARPKGTNSDGERAGDELLTENAKKAIPTVAKEETTAATIAAPAPGAGDADPAKQLVKADATAQVETAAGTTIADTDTFVVSLDAPAGKVGAESAFTISVVAKTGWKLNAEFPTKLKIEPPSGVKVPKATQKKADAVEFSEKKGASWKVPYTAASAGAKQFTGELRFAVCTDATCDPKKADLSFSVDVK